MRAMSRGLLALSIVAGLSALWPQAATGQGPAAARRKVFIDQDGAALGSDMISVLAMLQAPDVDVLGITVTAGDVWANAGTLHMLRMLELTGHQRVPVAQGATRPLINSRELTAAWEAQYGEFSYKGAWIPRRYHEPDEVPPPPTGMPSLKPIDLHGALFLIQQVRKHPHEVTLWVGGPLTTVALALGLDPEIATLARELVLMGAGFNVDRGGNHHLNGRREFNWWWDAEATRIVMSAPWKKITITPVDVSVKTSLGDDLKRRLVGSSSKAAQFVTTFHPLGNSGNNYMWDEISVLAFLDPSVVTRQQELFVNVDIDHGASYGQTIFVDSVLPGPPGEQPRSRSMPSWWRVSTVVWDLDLPRFYDLFVKLMTR
jgi:inosine-uridine nucleoside N-ribohydrolase